NNDSIGGLAAGAGNLIAFNQNYGVAIVNGQAVSVNSNTIRDNGGAGIIISPSTQIIRENRLTRNSVFHNGGLGIDLDGGTGQTTAGVTPNDFQDADTGANEL